MRSAVHKIQATLLFIILLATTALASDWARAVALYNKSDFRGALAEFQDIVLERPDAAGAWYYIGLCEMKLKRFERVELPMSRAIDLLEMQTPASADIAGAWYTMGAAHFMMSSYEKAIESLKKYMDLTAKAKREVDPAARAALARSYYFLGRYDEALPLLSAKAPANKSNGAVEKSKESAADYYYLGVIYFKREDDDRAITALREAMNANPEDPAAIELLAESLMRKAGKTNSKTAWAEAAEVSERLKAARDDDKTASIMGRAYLGAGQFEKAVAPFEKIAKANPDNGQAWLYYGIALSRSGQLRKAMEALEITIQVMPDSVPAMAELAYVYETDKQYQQALRIYEKAYAATSDPAIKASIDRVRALASQPQ